MLASFCEQILTSESFCLIVSNRCAKLSALLKKHREQAMKVVNRFDESGRLVYSSEIIRDIVDCALSEVEGVVKYPENSKLSRESIKADYIDDEVYIDVYVKLAYNVEVSDVASSIQSTVKNTIENMTEFKVKDVNVHVIEVEFEEN